MAFLKKQELKRKGFFLQKSKIPIRSTHPLSTVLLVPLMAAANCRLSVGRMWSAAVLSNRDWDRLRLTQVWHSVSRYDR